VDEQPIEPTTGSHGTTGNAAPDDISAILAIAHEAAEAEREGARATAAAIIADAEAEARAIRDRASAEMAANLTSAAEMRRAAADAQLAAELRAAQIIAGAEAERATLDESMEADRTTTRTSLEAVIRDLHSAIGRLDGSSPGHGSSDATIDVTDDSVAAAGEHLPDEGEAAETDPGTGSLNAAVRAVMARAIGSQTPNPS
jgi:hypothetical protein